ncbi:MAG: helix-turn-helix transcriptional regulator [Verrucomicrobiae bacterium]|nr:helix-turn-helix transcriptional regulator [Verrucomicrobiae bacterium]
MALPSDGGMVLFLGMEKRDGKTFDRSLRCRLDVLQPHFGNARRLAYLLSTSFPGETPVKTEIFERAGFSHRQSDVLALLLIGKTNPEISLALGISLPTVKGHLAAIFDKFGVDNRHAAMLRAYEIVRPPAPIDDPSAQRAATRAEAAAVGADSHSRESYP